MYLLAIESSCDDTAVSVLKDGEPLSNVVSSQMVHERYGGVVPEMASREHQKNIVQVCRNALNNAGIGMGEIGAIAATIGPGLPGSLLVGATFAKGLSLSLGIPLIGVNHMEAHVLSLLISQENLKFPYLCLVVSGGHTMLVLVTEWNQMQILGQTQDDAVGEAFDKCAKLLGFRYPGGKIIDDLATTGNPTAFSFPVAKVPELQFSYSGVKTAVQYFLREKPEEFIKENLNDLCASIQNALLKPLVSNAVLAMKQQQLQNLGICGGVAANKGLRKILQEEAKRNGWKLFVPDFEYCTDNAAMIGRAAWYLWKEKKFSPLTIATEPRMVIGQ